MKRLNCTFDPKKDKDYPWLLKHPKIKFGLARFKSRQDALEWYMSLNFETSIWFQDETKIFDGQLTVDFDKEEWKYYVKTAGFDGNSTYTGICKELNINPATFKHEHDNYKEWVKKLDFKLLYDPQAYFPADLEILKKASKKDLVDEEVASTMVVTEEIVLEEKPKEVKKVEEEVVVVEKPIIIQPVKECATVCQNIDVEALKKELSDEIKKGFEELEANRKCCSEDKIVPVETVAEKQVVVQNQRRFWPWAPLLFIALLTFTVLVVLLVIQLATGSKIF